MEPFTTVAYLTTYVFCLLFPLYCYIVYNGTRLSNNERLRMHPITTTALLGYIAWNTMGYIGLSSVGGNWVHTVFLVLSAHLLPLLYILYRIVGRNILTIEFKYQLRLNVFPNA